MSGLSVCDSKSDWLRLCLSHICKSGVYAGCIVKALGSVVVLYSLVLYVRLCQCVVVSLTGSGYDCHISVSLVYMPAA